MIRFLVALMAILLLASSAYAYRIIQIGERSWVVQCADGSATTFEGSADGVFRFANEHFCRDAGYVTPDGNSDRRVALIEIVHIPTFQELISAGDRTSIYILNSLQNPPNPCGAGLFPPECYPCLGCEPCGDGSGDFCAAGSAAFSTIEVHHDLKSGRLLVSPDVLLNGTYTFTDGRLSPTTQRPARGVRPIARPDRQ